MQYLLCLTVFLACYCGHEAHIWAHIQTDELANNRSAYFPQSYDTQANSDPQAHHKKADT
jgi:hypothetical protein